MSLVRLSLGQFFHFEEDSFSSRKEGLILLHTRLEPQLFSRFERSVMPVLYLLTGEVVEVTLLST